MHRLGDDMELDKLSRDAADKYSSPGQPDWNAMSAKLDEVMPVSKRRRFSLLWFAVPAVLLTGGYLFLSRTADSKADTPVASVSKTNAPASVAGDARPSVDVVEENKNSIATEEVPSYQIIPAGKSSNATVSKTNSTRKNNQDGLQTAVSNPGQSAKQSQPATLAVTDHKTGARQQQAPPANTSLEKAVAKGDEVQPQQSNPTINKVVTEEAPVGQTKTAAETQQEIPTPARTSNFGKPVVYPPLGKGFSIAILAGADKSTVKFRYGNDPGYNLGMLVGYYLNSRWSIHTGAVYTQKNYKMAGEDFNAPKGSVPSYYKLENVEGYCRMWDVPLLARYTLKPHGNNNFYLSAGLSSYFMTSEHYGYFYYYQGNPVTRNMTYASDDTHLLSILHLSGGFETRMSNRMTLQIEPYAKLPMGGVGFGDVRLSSFGINAALQLRQLSKK
jgi:hypothetical protein